MTANPLNGPAQDPRLDALLRQLNAAQATNIGFPAAVDIDYRNVAPLFAHLLNNVGDPDADPTHPNHSKDLEREVLAFLAGLFRAPERWWGYITSGGSESNLYALYLARSRYPDGIVYHSTAAHYSVPKAAHLLGMTTVVVDSQPNGEIDYDQFVRLVRWHRDRPVIVVANIGTTMTEAIDDVGQIRAALDRIGITQRYIHSDAALAGIPLALADDPPGFDFADGADSICVSGHKFLGTPLPCSAVIAPRRHTAHLDQLVAYTGCADGTITGSRNGHAAVMMWSAIRRYGREGLRARTYDGRELAAYTCRRLREIGWPSWRNPEAMTVVLRTPPSAVLKRWPLPTSGGWSHVICMPGVSRTQIDQFVNDIVTATVPHDAPILGASVPLIGPSARPAPGGAGLQVAPMEAC
ncbi:histidine decarboxylase [Micromonospora sp. WMMD1155]|uniref:histidine decarboxylase n=1 Tax=Micromonospora sp. WMMD1155 TaxID=3016094 RepID=UPI002499E82C|nr:histidine decarboxylase [Micromonospora sp. WMMD1155]WFE52984.1 histidine decarboxylase [Micromonospora sp. WMMD1155]